MEWVGDVVVDRGRGRVYEHGWQSWSPSGVWAARSGVAVPSIRAELDGETVRVWTDWPEELREHVTEGSLDEALASWADGFAGRQKIRAAPTVWCTWYQYYGDVTDADVLENLEAIEKHGLPVDVVQIDDGPGSG